MAATWLSSPSSASTIAAWRAMVAPMASMRVRTEAASAGGFGRPGGGFWGGGGSDGGGLGGGFAQPGGGFLVVGGFAGVQAADPFGVAGDLNESGGEPVA